MCFYSNLVQVDPEVSGLRKHHLRQSQNLMAKLKERHTTLKIIATIGLLIGLTSCSHYVYPPKVDTRTEISYSFKMNKNYETSKLRKSSQKTGYQRYDKKGNLIEEADYGEIWRFRSETKNADSSINITSGHGYNYKNLNTVHYYIYDNNGKKHKTSFGNLRTTRKTIWFTKLYLSMT